VALFLSFSISVSTTERCCTRASWSSEIPLNLFLVVASYTATCSSFLCILLQWGWINLIHQNLETPLHPYRGNRRTWYCRKFVTIGRLRMEEEFVPVVFNFWTWPRQRGTTRRQEQQLPVAEPRRDGTSGCGTSVSVEQDRTQERLHHQPGRELGLGECPPVRAFTLPTWR